MMPILHETQILSPINIFSYYSSSEILFIEMCENYQKRSFRNRYSILTSQGPLSLTIPLRKGKNNQMLISEVAIAYDEPWIDNHCNTIKSAYGKSPFFEFYFDDYRSILESKHEKLVDLNMTFLKWALRKLKSNLEIKLTTEYLANTSDYIDTRKSYKAVNAVPYPQVWQEKFDFVPNLSILDLLFCQGNQALSILKQMQDQ